MLTVSCLCGGLSVSTSALPDYVNECNCTLCRKAGALWAYYAPEQVSVSGEAKRVRRRDKSDPMVDVQFCPDCGSTTHFTLTGSAIRRFGKTMMGVNLRLAREDQLVGVEVRYPDGASWEGEGAFAYVREPRILGSDQRTPAPSTPPAPPSSA